MNRNEFHLKFGSKKPIVLPVIHVLDHEQTHNNITTAIFCGCPGVFLINHDFDKETHSNYLAHEDINNLKGLEVELIFKWKIGDLLIFDRTHLHCSSKNINKKKLGFTSSTKKI